MAERHCLECWAPLSWVEPKSPSREAATCTKCREARQMWGVKDASGRLLFIAHQIVGGLPCGAPDESAQSLLYARAEIAELEGVVADLDDRLAKPFKRDYERDVVAADKERTLAEIHGWGLLSAWLSAHQPRAVAA